MARIPVLPEATFVGALAAHTRHPASGAMRPMMILSRVCSYGIGDEA
jgi:hypothetical protein